MSYNSFDMLQSFLAWSAIIAASIISFIIFFRLIAIISLHLNKKTVVAQNAKLIDSIIKTKSFFDDNQETYLSSIQSLGLNQTINCSSAVVNNSTLNTIKYLLKYANIDYSVESLEKLDYLEIYTEQYSKYARAIENAFGKYKKSTPIICRLFIGKNKIISTLCGIDSKLELSYPYLYFLYISPAGRTRRGNKIIVDEDVVAELRSEISSKMTKKGHTKKQRSAMTQDLREAIKKRDNYTCQICGNSVLKEPNLLLEVDHIIPVSKGGKTEADNLQTLCWRCNRAKSNKD